MFYSRIDHLAVAASGSDVEQTTAPFRRLGLSFVPPAVRTGRGRAASACLVGAGTAATTLEFHALTNREEALHAGPQEVDLVAAADAGRGLFHILLGCEDAAIADAVATLHRRGLDATVYQLSNRFGETMPAVYLHLPAVAAVPLGLLGGLHWRPVARARFALAPNTFPLKRLDHLAAIAPDLDASTHFWTDVLGIPLHGEVRTATSIIRQFKIGDAIIELLGPATPDSPLAQRPPGLVSMAAFEVTDMGAAVAQARAAGFTVADPAPGSLPGTRVTTIPGSELSGLALQLLEYV
jgi:catechol 2,3-dioxygenase-like lactoylglutathione lyase family enzyme